MNRFAKRLAILAVLIIGISAGVIYMTIDADTLMHLNVFKPWSLLAAILFISVGMYFDGSRLMHLVWISGERITLSQAVQVIFSNYFLALLTPGAAGGAFAQVMFLRRAGVTTGKATVLVLVRTILSILFLLVCLPAVFYFDPGLMPWFSTRELVLGSVAMIGGILAGIWLFRTPWPKRILLILTKKMKHRRRRKIFLLYAEMRSAVLLLSSSPGSMMRVFCESALSLLALYSIVPVLFLGMGMAVDWGQLLGRMVFLNLFLYFAPTPGGAGIAEGGFVWLFNEFLPAGTVGIVAVAWRILAEYLPFSIGLYYTIKVFGRDFLAKMDKEGVNSLKIAVTGGAGFIGSHVAEKLLAEGLQVTVIDDLSSGLLENIPANANFVHMDIRSEELQKFFAAEKFDGVAHLAAQTMVPQSLLDPGFDCEVNIQGTINVLEACRKGKTKRIVFSSSAAVYGDNDVLPLTETSFQQPTSFYGLSKLTAEKYLHLYYRLFGVEYVVLRYANVYGERQGDGGEGGVVSIFSRLIRQKKALTIFGDGEQTRDFIYVGDVASANYKALLTENANTVYNVSTGFGTSVNELVAAMEKAAEKPVERIYAAPREGDIYHSRLDCSTASEKLAWQAIVALQDGLRRTYQSLGGKV